MKHSFADVNLRLGYTLQLYKSVNMELFGLPKSHPLIAAFELQFREAETYHSLRSDLINFSFKTDPPTRITA